MEWNIAAEAISLVMIGIIGVYARKGSHLPTLKNRIFQWCLTVTFSAIFTNILSTIMIQQYRVVPIWLTWIVTMVYFVLTPLMGMAYFLYTVSVIYTEKGVFEEYLFLPSNPDMVLMDTEVIAQSPVRLTVSGMGDALATYFEARAVLAKDALTCAGGHGTLAAHALAKLCFDTLMEEGVKAKLALEAGACTPAVEKIIEANTLLSGIGFESGGLAGAHAIHNGFTVLEECHHMYHGEKVAFGTITQLVLEDMPADELEDVIGFCIDVGLPVTLKELGVEEVTKEKIMAVAEAACAETDTLHNMPFEVTPEKVYAAIMAADAYGNYFKGM